MDIELRYFDGCPHWQVAKSRLKEALEMIGQSSKIDLQRVETLQEADELGFRGSPTVLIDGLDPFDAPGPPGLSCRIYRTDAGLGGSPSVQQLVDALKRAQLA